MLTAQIILGEGVGYDEGYHKDFHLDGLHTVCDGKLGRGCGGRRVSTSCAMAFSTLFFWNYTCIQEKLLGTKLLFR